MDILTKSTEILNANTPEQVLEILENWLRELTGDLSPSIFLLSTQKAVYLQIQKKGFSQNSRPLNFQFDSGRHLVSRRRQDVVIAFIEVKRGMNVIDEKQQEAISAGLNNLYSRLYLANYFSDVKKPLDFTNRETYFPETAKLISNALGMEMVAIRRVTQEGDLKCLAFFREEVKACDIGFNHDSMPPPFKELLDNVKKVLQEDPREIEQILPLFEEVIDANNERHSFLTQQPQIDKVRAFAVFPIIFEDELYGVISCSTTAPLSFSEVERMTIGTTMQIISISISNYNRYHEAKALEAARNDQLFNMTAVEIAQSTRHELGNILAEQQLQYLKINKNLHSDKNIKPVKEGMDELFVLIERFGESIQKLKYNTPSNTSQLQMCNLKDIWESAVNLIQQRLDYLNIKVNYVGSDINDMFYPDWLKSAFLNLLLNSIDAYKNRQKKQNRAIRLVIQKSSDQANDYTLDYSDNAGGINFTKLHIPSNIIQENKNMPNEQLIFQPKVTTKKDKGGSGWGLYLIRRAIDLHKGSINLHANTNDSCTFRINLRKRLTDNK